MKEAEMSIEFIWEHFEINTTKIKSQNYYRIFSQ